MDSWFLIMQLSLIDVYNLAMSLHILLFPLGSFTKYYTLKLPIIIYVVTRFLHKILIKQFAEV